MSASRAKAAWRCANSQCPAMKAEIKVGDEVEVYVDRVENAHGEAVLSA
jgi:ribosomal protein S1